MKINTIYRMAIWASVGVLIALAWGIYFAGADKGLAITPTVRALAALTQPAVAAVLSFEPSTRISIYSSAVANTAAYTLLGLVVESLRRSYRVLVAN
ncbi:MAG: hypothetical protein O3A53_18270 [Acidobacteria bacterium]|nr:hypothetical protein [Acidobacteriota bacterium]MDA1236733.1 hypothetical protein [Acidobacteriota bacterium]